MRADSKSDTAKPTHYKGQSNSSKSDYNNDSAPLHETSKIMTDSVAFDDELVDIVPDHIGNTGAFAEIYPKLKVIEENE